MRRTYRSYVDNENAVRSSKSVSCDEVPILVMDEKVELEDQEEKGPKRGFVDSHGRRVYQDTR